jgi:N-acyl-D-amino-acid deacylase
MKGVETPIKIFYFKRLYCAENQLGLTSAQNISGRANVADFDLVIRNAVIVDGSGGTPFTGDLAVSSGKISQIGSISGTGKEEIDAAGKFLTPGFVDIHTHYDGQITWEHTLAPSSNHGVTTVLMGNCGVGFAPCRPSDRAMTIRLMEGVEDIPGVVMDAGVPWNWETFPDYLDALDKQSADVDFAAQLPHSPLRVFVMGERGANLEAATEEDLAEMRRLTMEAAKAGAIGVSTSRSLTHRFPDGRPAPSVKTADLELLALARGLRDAGTGVFQIIPNIEGVAEEELDLMQRLVEASGRPLSFSLLNLSTQRANWLKYLEFLAKPAGENGPIRAQFYPRPLGVLFGLDLTYHPFALNPSYRAIADLPLAEKVAVMRDPAFRARLIGEKPADPNPAAIAVVTSPRDYFVLGNPPNYRPAPGDSIAAQAALRGEPLLEALYDALLADDGQAVLYSPSSTDVGVTVDEAGPLFDMPNAVLGLGDGGAHYGLICDAPCSTYLLSDWVRDGRGPKLSLERAIKSLTSDPALAIGLNDRGLLKVGYKADLNLIDLENLRLHAPSVVRDLPAAGRRIVQSADGYVATIVSGKVTYRNGQSTGELPGRLVRGGKAAVSLAA